MEFFRTLSAEEIVVFKTWARENYEPGSRISPLWHPVIQEECSLINHEVTKDLKKIQEEEDRQFWGPQ